MQSIKWGQQHIEVDRSDENTPKISGTLPDELLLEGLYRRFRFFILNDEKSNYFRLLKLLSQNSSNQLLHTYCRFAKKEFFHEGSLQFAFITSKTKYKPEQVINFWFNSYYFHDIDAHRKEREIFQNIVSSQGAKIVLWQAVWNAVKRVRYLNWLLRDTSEKNQIIYVKKSCETHC